MTGDLFEKTVDSSIHAPGSIFPTDPFADVGKHTVDQTHLGQGHKSDLNPAQDATVQLQKFTCSGLNTLDLLETLVRLLPTPFPKR